MPSLQSLLKPCTLNSSVVANLFHMMQSVALRAVMPSTYSPKPRPKSCNPSGGCYLFRYRSIRRLVDGKRRGQPGEHTNPKALRPKPAATSPKLLAPNPKNSQPRSNLTYSDLYRNSDSTRPIGFCFQGSIASPLPSPENLGA